MFRRHHPASRQGISCFSSAHVDWLAPALLFGGAAMLAWRFPLESLVGAVALVPVLNGLDRIGLLGTSPGVSLVFSGVFIGAVPRVWKSNGGIAACLADGCILLLSGSLIGLLGAKLTPENAASLWQQPLFGYGQVWMGVRAAFVLILGLAIFRILICERAGLDEFTVQMVMAAQLASIALFAILQRALFLPEPYYANLGGVGASTFIPTSPGDDIHTFGGLAIICLGFFLGALPRKKFALVGVFCAAVLVLFSWSRAAWAAAAVMVFVWLWRRGLKKTITVTGLAAVSFAVAVAGKSDHWGNVRNHFARRLILLADVSHWFSQDSARVELYRKAIRMIEAHPLGGVGIGQFFTTSAMYGRPSDPAGPEPQFAHNALLQLAAETGLPCGMLFAAFFFWVLWKGRTASATQDGMWLASIGFAVTQLTSNAVNIFDSQAALMGWVLGVAWLARSPNA